MSIEIEKAIDRQYLKDNLRHFEKHLLWDEEIRGTDTVLIPKYYNFTEWKANKEYWIGQCVIYNDDIYVCIADVDSTKTDFPETSFKVICTEQSHLIYKGEVALNKTTRTNWNDLLPSRCGDVWYVTGNKGDILELNGIKYKANTWIINSNSLDLKLENGSVKDSNGTHVTFSPILLGGGGSDIKVKSIEHKTVPKLKIAQRSLDSYTKDPIKDIVTKVSYPQVSSFNTVDGSAFNEDKGIKISTKYDFGYVAIIFFPTGSYEGEEDPVVYDFARIANCRNDSGGSNLIVQPWLGDHYGDAKLVATPQTFHLHWAFLLNNANDLSRIYAQDYFGRIAKISNTYEDTNGVLSEEELAFINDNKLFKGTGYLKLTIEKDGVNEIFYTTYTDHEISLSEQEPTDYGVRFWLYNNELRVRNGDNWVLLNHSLDIKKIESKTAPKRTISEFTSSWSNTEETGITDMLDTSKVYYNIWTEYDIKNNSNFTSDITTKIRTDWTFGYNPIAVYENGFAQNEQYTDPIIYEFGRHAMGTDGGIFCQPWLGDHYGELMSVHNGDVNSNEKSALLLQDLDHKDEGYYYTSGSLRKMTPTYEDMDYEELGYSYDEIAFIEDNNLFVNNDHIYKKTTIELDEHTKCYYSLTDEKKGDGGSSLAIGDSKPTGSESLWVDTSVASAVGLLARVYPIGSIYLTMSSANPRELFGFGTWTKISEGRTLIGSGTNDSVTYSASATGGSRTNTIAQENIPNYSIGKIAAVVPSTHEKWNNGGVVSISLGDVSTVSPTYGGVTATSDNKILTGTQFGWQINTNGGGEAINNMQPYLVTNIWQRTA